MIDKLKISEKEEKFLEWAVKLQHSSRKNRIKDLKRHGFL